MSAVAVVGPSGAGKDTLMAMAVTARSDIRCARRVITRPSAAGGEDFEGVSPAEFAARKAHGAFALDWQAHGLSYGIPTAELAGDCIVLVNLSRAVLGQAQTRLPGLRVVLVTAPPAILAARLSGRGRETQADQDARLSRAGFALPVGITAQVVMNDTSPDEGLARFLAALQPDRG